MSILSGEPNNRAQSIPFDNPAPAPESADTGGAAPTTETPATPPETTQGGQQDGTTETATPATSETQPGQETPGTAAPAPQAAAAPALDPELETFARGKGIDPAELAKNPVLQTVLKSSRESEAEMNRLRAEIQKQTEAKAAAAAPILPDAAQQGQPQAPKVLSPLQQVKKSFTDAVAVECFRIGCESERELREQYPDRWNELHNLYMEARDEALEKENSFHVEEAKKIAEQSQQQQEITKFLADTKAKFQENVASARQQNPRFDTDYIRYGAKNVIDEIASASGFEPHMMLANPRVFAFVSKAVAAIGKIESGEYKKQLHAEWAAAEKKQQQALVPSANDDSVNIPAWVTSAPGRGNSLLR